MKNAVVVSALTLTLLTALFVSQVEAKSDFNNNTAKVFQNFDRDDWRDFLKKIFGFLKEKHNDNRSVPIPGTLLLLGGGFAGLAAWRARQRKPGA